MYKPFSTYVGMAFRENLDSVETFSQRYGISSGQAQRLVDGDPFSPEEAMTLSKAIGRKDIFLPIFV